MSGAASITVIIVNYNHEASLGLVVASLLEQDLRPERIIVVDCGSRITAWRDEAWARAEGVEIVFARENLGFTGGNNLAWSLVEPMCEWVLFLNPDVLLPPQMLGSLLEQFEGGGMKKVAAISPRLAAYDFHLKCATGEFDSLGVFPSFFGWADRRLAARLEDRVEQVPALCGAFMLCRVAALRAVERPSGGVFDEHYFAYKEDIELSLRLRRAGWALGLWHGGEAFHGRGWQERSKMSRFARLLSARNEVRLHAAYAPLKLPMSVIKWLAVLLLDL